MQAEAQEIIDAFPDWLHAAYGGGMAAKLGLEEFGEPDWVLLTDLLELMHQHEADHTLTFRRLSELADDRPDDAPVGEIFTLPDAFDDWLERWERRLDEDGRPRSEIADQMREVNPIIVARNHRVEAAIEDAVERSDFETFHTLADVLAEPYEFPDEHPELLEPPAPDERVEATFCGT